MKMVQVTSDAKARPIITALTTTSADLNIVHGDNSLSSAVAAFSNLASRSAGVAAGSEGAAGAAALGRAAGVGGCAGCSGWGQRAGGLRYGGRLLLGHGRCHRGRALLGRQGWRQRQH